MSAYLFRRYHWVELDIAPPLQAERCAAASLTYGNFNKKYTEN